MNWTPSIQTLRAFDAAATLQSYTKAAETLHITHGAISHQIRHLERRIGARLFERCGHLMVPTPTAQKLLIQVRQILGLLDAAFPVAHQATHGASNRRPVVLSVLPAFASRWLMARLSTFSQMHPEIEIDLRVSPDLADFEASDIDAALRYGPGGWPGVTSMKLADEYLFPVCSPSFAAEYPIEKVEHLAGVPLLRSSWQPWTPWFRAAKLDASEPLTGPSFSDAGLLLQAAESGSGVALARYKLAADALDAGNLVRLFDVSVRDIYSYYFVERTDMARRAEVGVLKQWIRDALGA